MNNNNPNIQVLKASETGLFTNYIYKAIPLAFDESMSYYECLCGLLNYLQNTVIPTVNNNADAVIELQNLYTQLHNYVKNYFDNLDVQEEINNKLDSMVEDGSLTQIIKNYVDPYIEAQNQEISSFKNLINTEVNVLDNKINSATSGSPKGVYDTVSDLQTADPDHNYIYVVVADGKWYYYDTSDSQWTIGGQYQVANYPEITDIRTAYNDFTYTSAGDSVREQVNDIHTILNEGFYFDRTYTAYNGESQEVESGAYYIASNGNTTNNASYLAYSMQIENDSWFYPSISSTFQQVGIYNSSTFSSSTLIKKYDYTQNNIPTIDNPIQLQTGWYLVVVGKYSPTININLSTSYELKLNNIKSNQIYNYTNGVKFLSDKILDSQGLIKEPNEEDITNNRYPTVMTKPIEIINGTSFELVIKQTSHTEQQNISICYYDKNLSFISRDSRNITLQLESDMYVARYSFIANIANAKYINICYRTYNDQTQTFELLTNFNINLTNKNINQLIYNKSDMIKPVYPFDNLFPLSIAHRGDEAVAPENTLPAFRLAKRKGWDFIETDLAFTSDNVCVLLHDASINRVARNSDGTSLSDTVNIVDITYEQALTYSFGYYKDAIYADVKICTLEELLQLCQALKLYAVLEIKTEIITSNTQYANIYNLLIKYNMTDKVIFTSSSPGNLRPLMNIDKQLAFMISRSASDDDSSIDPLGYLLKTDYNKVFIGYQGEYLTTESINNCKSHGLYVGYYLGTTSAGMNDLPRSLDFVTSDNLPYSKALYENNIGDEDTGLLD